MIGALRREGPLHIVEVLRHHRRRLRWARAEESLPDATLFLASTAAGAERRGDALQGLALRARGLLHPWLLDREATHDTVRLLNDEFAEDIVDAADRIASGRFTLLGLSLRESDGELDWHRDYISGKSWPLERFDRIDFLSGDGADVKYPWELSRMTWTGSLGLAHTIAPDDRLPTAGELPEDAFRRLVDDWVTANPYGRGVNWAMPMEVALRSFWLVSSLSLFFNEDPDRRGWWRDYVGLIAGHGRALHHTLEYLPNLTNHYIADCFGLLVIGALFIDSKEGLGWFREGRRRLERELRRQVTGDGFHYERSLPYHGLVLELYLVAALVAARTGSPLGHLSLEIIDRMARITAHTIPHHGQSIPLLGDADDGRLLRLFPETDLYDHSFLLELHAGLRDANQRRTAPESIFLLGASRDGTQAIVFPDRSELFAEGGLAVLRNDRATCIADVGPIGLHGNNDTLSFTLYGADGTPWIVDPGTGCYTGDPVLRNSLRSTGAHNTLMVDNREIAEFAGLWRVREDRTKVEIGAFHGGSGRTGDPVVLRARHHAWEAADRRGVVHEREWVLEGDMLRITDRLLGTGSHQVAIRFTLDAGVSAVEEHGGYRLREESGNAIRFECSIPLELQEGILSPSYGLLLPAQTLQFNRQMSVPTEIEYLCRFPSDRSRTE